MNKELINKLTKLKETNPAGFNVIENIVNDPNLINIIAHIDNGNSK